MRFVGEYDKVVLCRLLVFSFYILVDVENSEDIPLAAAGKNNGGIPVDTSHICKTTYMKDMSLLNLSCTRFNLSD